MTDSTAQKMCVWSGAVFLVAFFLALWPAAHFLPPPSPRLDADEVVAIYVANTSGIRLGSILVFLGGACIIPFVAVISVQMRRIEPRATAVLSYAQLTAGALGVVLFMGGGVFWTVAAFRLSREPGVTQALNDIGWIFFLMNPFLALIQNVAIGSAIISDKRPRPVFPRWVAYVNFWSAVLFLPGVLITYFKTGPFAWDGLFAFWLPLIVFGGWFCIMVPCLLKAIDQQSNAEL